MFRGASITGITPYFALWNGVCGGGELDLFARITGIVHFGPICSAFPGIIEVQGIGLLDSAVGGNMLARGELVEPLIIGSDEPPV